MHIMHLSAVQTDVQLPDHLLTVQFTEHLLD